jgi:hypothetical protein
VKPVEFVSDKEFREKSIQAKWQINSESPEFIHSIAYHHDGTTTIIGEGEDRVVTYPKPYDQGFTGTSFISGEYTNIDGYSVPTFFQFPILRPGYGPTNSLGVFAGIQGKVTEFSAGVDIQSFYPETIRKTFVTDKRFQAMGMEDFSYIIEKGGSWLQLGSPELDQHIRYYQRNYAKLLSSKPTLKPTNKRIIVISLVLLISALFCVVLWRLSRANRSAP